jgi:hypothetical protein
MKGHLGIPFLVLAGAAFLAGSVLAAQPDRPPERRERKVPALLKAEPIQPDKKDDELHRLLKERYNEAVAELAALYAEFQHGGLGRSPMDTAFHQASQRLLHAGLELKEKPADKVALLEQYVELQKFVEKFHQDLVNAGHEPPTLLHQARYYRIDAEIQLLRAKKAQRR